MKILVVEDDRSISQTLELLLSEQNYAIDVAADGEAGLQMVEAFEYDLVMLDVLLPKLDGITLCQQIRAKRCQMPILLLTGQGGGHQKAIALNAGADDYVVKPFDAEELMARVQALLRRGHSNHPLLTWGNLSLDPSSRRVTYGTHLLTLTPKEYAILELFLRNSQTTLSARAILDHAWAATESPGDEAVRVHIKELRHKLKTVGAPKDWIKTVHRVGYQLNPLYSSALATQTKGLPTVSEIAELKSVNEELRTTLEELRVTEDELREQNEELHLARLTIEQERQHYQDLFEFAPDGYLVTDLHGTIREANRAAIALLGYQYLIGKPLAVFIAKSDRTTFRNRLAGLKQVQNWEITLKPRHNQPFPVLVSVTQIKDAQNQVSQLRWSLRDIRERKCMEQQLQAAHNELEQRVVERTTELVQANLLLQESEATFRHFAENSHAVLWIAQPTSVDCLYVSPAYEKIWGRSRQNLIDCPDSWMDAIHPDDRDQVRTKLEQQRQGESSNVEYRIVRPDGSVRWIWDRGFAIRNEAGEVYRFGGIAEDITDRLRVEDDRNHAEQKIREQAALLDITSDAIFVRDLDHHILYWNRGAERLYGWQATETLSQPAHELLQENASQIAEIMQILLSQGEWQGELRKVTKTGREVISAGRWTLVRDNAGHPKFILTVDTDITEKKQLEAQSYRAQRLESLGTLASGIAHDLNNLLTPILAISQLMRQMQTNADARSQEMLKVLEESAQHGANMVQQILTFTQGTEGEHIPVHIAALLQEVITVAQQTFPRSIVIHQDIPTSGIGLISADATQLHQVFMNLAVNARDAMPNGGVLRITAENVFLDDAFARMNLEAHPGSYIVVTVSDTGTGIPPELLERIFDPFFTTKEVGKGTGLGLSTILGIVKNHGGFIEVCSKVGQGSQFKVFLPTTGNIQNEGDTCDTAT
jgi:PAS domain S-box-containing protein